MQNKTNTSSIFALEGNIGAGKSTFLKIINSKLKLSVIQEPANKWQDMDGTGNLLDLFYQDAKRWAFTFQTYAFMNRYQTAAELLQKNIAPTHILERSIFCDRYCFAHNCHEMGFMTAMEWKIYTEMFSLFLERLDQHPTGFVYLRTTPETCLERIGTRNRSEEKSIPLSYLELLHQKHEDWLVHKNVSPNFVSQIPVLILDFNQNIEKDIDIQNDYLNKLTNFIKQTQNNLLVTPKAQFVQENRNL